jgi:hypothetical protein
MSKSWKGLLGALGFGITFCILGVVAGSNSGSSSGPSIAAPTPSIWERLDDSYFREQLAARVLKPALRDPDSLVVESTSDCAWRTFGKKRLLCFWVTYRAKNGFGGYNREAAWIVSQDDDGQSWRLGTELKSWRLGK